MIKRISISVIWVLFFFFAEASTITVSNTNDSGSGSLRQAILDAVNGDHIVISTQGIINLNSMLPVIDQTITITGHSNGTVLDGQSSKSIMFVQIQIGTVTLQNLNFKDGYSANGAASGLIAITGNNGKVSLNNCSFIDCVTSGSQAFGGAIATSADMDFVNCTLYGNSSAESGGAIASLSDCTINLTNCTIYKNHTNSSSGSGGLDLIEAGASIQNTILAGNTAGVANTNSDLLTSSGASLSSLGNNLSNTDPFTQASDLYNKNLSTEILLSDASFQSGMYVCQLQDGSVAIDNANNAAAPTSDQIGQSRLGDADIGSFEIQSAIAPTLNTNNVNSIGLNTVTLNAYLITLGSPDPSEHGFVYDTSVDPDISLETKTEKGAIGTTGPFSSEISNLIPNTTYYVRAYATNNAGTVYGNEVSFTTLAAAATTFNSAGNWSNVDNWSDGKPAITSEAIIAANCTLDENYEVADLTINSGSVLNIPANTTLTVSSNLTNNNGVNGIIIEADDTGTGRLICDDTNVSATVQQYFVNNQWHYFGKPISNSITALSSFRNFYLVQSDESKGETNPWSYLGASDTIYTGTGYGGFYKRSSGNDTIIQYQGTLNTGEIIVNTAYTNTTGDTCGWNLISNPYPCTLDWEVTNNSLINVNDAIYVWDPGAGSYASYVDGVSTGNQDQYIAPMQGFFVKSNTGTGSVTFTNTAKSDHVSTFKSSSVHELLRLIVFDPEERYDETALCIRPGSTFEFDGLVDAYKLVATNSKAPQIYTELEGKAYSINSLPFIEEENIIPLNVLTKTTGQHILSLNELSGYFSACNVFLFNSSGEMLVDLTQQDYVFNASQNETTHFHIGFKSNQTSQETNRTGKIYVNGKEDYINIFGLNNLPSKIIIYNAVGQVIYKNQVCEESMLIYLPGNNFYIVKIEQANQYVFTEKAVL